MTYTLLIWIWGCVGLECSIPDYEVRYFETKAECLQILDYWKNADERNRGACLPGRYVK